MRRRRKRSVVQVSWEEVGADDIKQLICIFEKLDGAVRFGRSRDGGVLSVGGYVGDERWTDWLTDDDGPITALDTLMDELIEDYEITDDDV